MITIHDLHRAQISVLSTLRHTPSARYSTLMRPTELDSDVFKFHLRKLVKQGYVKKTSIGSYTLTALGKEFANNLDKEKRAPQKQPKHSLLLVVSKRDAQGNNLYLFQERLRQPHWGYRGLISGPIRWGEDVEVAAARELTKQTGLSATFHTVAFCRQRDYEAESSSLLEDKMFYIMKAGHVTGLLTHTYPHGRSKWMTIDQLERHEKHFEPTRRILAMLEAGKTYLSVDVERRSDDF